MKLKQSILSLFSALIISVCSISAEAGIFDNIPDKAVSVHYKLTVAANTSTHTVLVDLSNTTNWPHKETGYIAIDALKVTVDKVAASSPTVKIGVVTFVDASTGSVAYAWSLDASKNVSNTSVEAFNNWSPSFLRLKVNPTAPTGVLFTDGSTPYLLSSEHVRANTAFQTDVILPNPYGTDAAPGLGDIILSVNNVDATNSVIVIVDLLYHSEAR